MTGSTFHSTEILGTNYCLLDFILNYKTTLQQQITFRGVITFFTSQNLLCTSTYYLKLDAIKITFF